MTESSKVVDAIATRDKTSMLCLRMYLLITLRTILNAIICCLQLNTGRGSDDNLKVDFLGIDACWIAVYVLCRNAQLNFTLLIITCMCMVMPSLFVNCPTVICSPNMLILIGETPLVNCGLRSYFPTLLTTVFIAFPSHLFAGHFCSHIIFPSYV